MPHVSMLHFEEIDVHKKILPIGKCQSCQSFSLGHGRHDTINKTWEKSLFSVKCRLTLRNEAILGSIVVSIPACHAGDRGSIPRRGG